jgi:predicted TIM-barrel fold metal-dependent hydrolase
VIVDCHCHAGQGEGLTSPWNTEAPLGKYLRRASAAGIDRSVLIPAGHTDYARANAGLARIVASDPDRFIGFASLHAVRDAGRVRPMLERAVREWGFRGVKVHRYDAPATREVCRAAGDLGIPVLYDVVGQAWRMELLAPQYRQVNFIVPHIGSFMDDFRAHVQVIDLLVRHPNVFTDTAGVRRFDYLVEAIRRAGPEKVLFGSDGPWLHPGLELEKVRLLRLPPADEALVMGGNLLRLIGRSGPPRPAGRARRRPGWLGRVGAGVAPRATAAARP